MAQVDSVYSKMVLGSAGYKSEFSFSEKYARPQAALIKRLKSAELAANALRNCYMEQSAVPPPETTLQEQARLCAKALSVSCVQGDTFQLAYGDPRIVNVSAALYLNNLMRVFQEDYMIKTLSSNKKTLDSISTLMDKEAIRHMNSRDTLFSFCSTSEFHKEAEMLCHLLHDSVAVMKSLLYSIGLDTNAVRPMFRSIDTLLRHSLYAFRDTLSPYWKQNINDLSIRMFELDHLLSLFSVSLQTMTDVVKDTSLPEYFRDRQKEFLVAQFTEQFNGQGVQRLYYSHNSNCGTPYKNKSFSPVLKRYRVRSAAYTRLSALRTSVVIHRTSLVPRSVIICRASKIKC